MRRVRLAVVILLAALAQPTLADDDACAAGGARSLLAITPFDAPIPSFSMWDRQLTEESLRRAFGNPLAIEPIAPGGKPEEGIVDIGRSWRFEGVRVETVQTEGETRLYAGLVEVTSAAKPLRCGVRVGIPLARVREILGPPEGGREPGSCEDSDTFFWLHTDVKPYFQGGEDPGFSLCVQSDAQGGVTRIRWTQLSNC